MCARGGVRSFGLVGGDYDFHADGRARIPAFHTAPAAWGDAGIPVCGVQIPAVRSRKAKITR